MYMSYVGVGRRPRMHASVHEKTRLESVVSAGQGAQAECTLNISPMILTRDVSKFTGWLNAVAACRGGGYDGKVSLGAGRACVTRERRLDWSLRHSRARAAVCTSNISSMFVTRDVSKFSGWLNADPSSSSPCRYPNKRGIRCGEFWCGAAAGPRMQHAGKGSTGV